MLRRILTIASLACALLSYGQTDTMRSGFLTPPKIARPQVWWHWMNGNISKEGIRKDLMWMSRVGIGGVHLFDAGLNTPLIVPRKIEYMTPEWNDCLRYAVLLADSLEMDVVLPSAPGWSNTGGPWVSVDDAMKRIEWRDTTITSSHTGIIKLPEPYTNSGTFQNWHSSKKNMRQVPYYKDLYVLALRVREKSPEMREMVKRVTCSEQKFDGNRLFDGDLTHYEKIGKGKRHRPCQITIELWKPCLVRSIKLADTHVLGSWAIYPDKPEKHLEASNDGINFSRVCRIPNSAAPQLTLAIPPTCARYFRLVYEQSAVPAGISEFTLSTDSRVTHCEEKAGFGGPICLIDYPTPATDDATPLDDVIDLTDHLSPDGTLRWNAPDGCWRIFRFGYSLTGKTNHPASAKATGLEVDKLDSAAMRRYMEAYLDTYRTVIGDSMMGKTVNGLLIDSYEAGYATWTGLMREEFRLRRGYDMVKWLPAITGQIMESAEASDRFLYDWRKTLSELITENLYGMADKIGKEQHLTTYFEAMEDGRAFVADGIEPKSRGDIPMGAMWARTQTLKFKQDAFLSMQADLKESASAAHLYGKNLVGAESFTVYGPSQGDSLVYGLYPAMLKRVADLEFACGVNRVIIHDCTHQPSDDHLPGLSLGQYGMWFNRHNTWAEQSKGWTDYIARSCYMLQQGTNVADVVYFYGDEANATALFGTKLPPVPATANYDIINSEGLVKLLSYDGTHLVTPGGAKYKMLVLGGTSERMSMSTLGKLHSLAEQGALISGLKPIKSVGMEADTTVFRKLADNIWNRKRTNVISTDSIALALDSAGIDPDFSCTFMDSIRFVHRTTGDAEIYWVNNRSMHRVKDVFSFRVTGKKPQLWDPVSGTVSDLTYSVGTRNTYIEADMQPAEAFFIVFSGEMAKNLRDRKREITIVSTDTIDTPWTIHFPKGLGTPESIVMDTLKSYIDSTLTIADQAQAKAIRYFSGTATYHNTFTVASTDTHCRVMLDMGTVNYIADVSVNGIHCGLSWTPPHSIDITDMVQTGINSLEIKITNPWKNRLCGDKLAGKEETKYTWTSYPWSKKTKNNLMPAGILGPVTIITTTGHQTAQ